MKDFLTKLFGLLLKNAVHVVAAVLLLIVFGLGYSYFKQSQELKKTQADLIGQKDAYQQVNQDLAKMGTDYVTAKDLAAQADLNWRNELLANAQLKKQLRGLASQTFSSHQDAHTGKADRTTNGSIYQEVAYDNGPPVGFVQTSNGTGAVTSKLFDHDLDIESAIAVDPKTGKVSIYSKGYYVLKEKSLADLDPSSGKKSWLGVKYPLTISGGTLVYTPGIPANLIPDRFQFATHLNAGTFGAATSLGGFTYGGHVDLTFAGYGKTKNDLDYKLLGLGANFNRDYIDFDVVPAYWRVANVLPLVSNVYIGPGVGLGSQGTSYFLVLGGTL